MNPKNPAQKLPPAINPRKSSIDLDKERAAGEGMYAGKEVDVPEITEAQRSPEEERAQGDRRPSPQTDNQPPKQQPAARPSRG